jgi:hypothetical protein
MKLFYDLNVQIHYIDLMDKKEKLARLLIEILRYLVPTMAILMFGGMFIEMIKGFQQTQYPTFFMNYAQISLTIFGFTLIGGIFERKKNKPRIMKNLFYLSLIFLSSSIGFIFLHTIQYYTFSGEPIEIVIKILVFIAMALGFIGFVCGLFFLLLLLVSFIKEI